MIKKILLFIHKLFSNWIFKLIMCIIAIAAIVLLRDIDLTDVKAGKKILEIIVDGNTLSVFLAGVITVLVAIVVRAMARHLEESMKIEDDHHKIVCKYSHKRQDIDRSKNLYAPDGVYMYLSSVNNKKQPKNRVSDTYSKAYTNKQNDICEFMGNTDGDKKCRLYLPSITVFTNVKGDTHVSFNDSKDKYVLPDFVGENAMKLIQAHKMSKIGNNVTVRLNDFSYDGSLLTLDTQRSQYLDMLITNRCMDYKMDDSLSMRDIYEDGERISPLSQSKLGNQIGINGLIITKDNYLLLEKRGTKKTTWKDKFAQPISLALKKTDLLKDADVMASDVESAEKAFKNVILNTIDKNYGITERDIDGFEFSTNFFGIARDLLEGGKPNMYFFVVVNKSAKELARAIEQSVRDKAMSIACPQKANVKAGKIDLSNDKMDSDYYLINRDDMRIDYDYRLCVRMRDIIKVRKKVYPRVSRAHENAFKLKQSLMHKLNKECGEALLACLYYYDACGDRINTETVNE